MLEVEFDGDTEIIVNTNVEVTASNTNVAIVEDTNDIEVTVNRQEYVITGDEIYIPKRFEDAPTWMQNLITQVVDTSISAQIQDLNEISQSLESMIDAMEVAKNTYEMSVISSNDIDQRINTAVTTLNSSMQEADSTILEVAQTRVTPEEASAITIDVISAQLGSTTAGTIGASVSELQTAIANEEEARSTSLEILTSSIEGAFDANATAMNYLNTYVGVDDRGGPTRTGLLADVEILQKQNDGVIETTTGTYDVMINPENPNLAQLVTTSEPYATWIALDTTGISNRLAHIGDVYVKYSDTANGAKEYIASYKFIRTVVDETSPYATDSDGFTWALVIDQAAQDAYEQALNAFDLADNKRRVFVSNPTVPYDEGDLWLVQAGSSIIGTTQGGRVIQAGDMLRCSETKEVNGLYEHNDWIPADNYRESMNAIQADLNSWRTGTYAPFVTSIQTQVDGKSETFYQNSIPTGRIKSLNVASNSILDKYVGDLWKNIYVGTVGGYLGNNTEYVYTKTANGSNWNYDWTKMEVPDIVFDTIDTKKSIYSGNSVPVAVAPDIVEINDMWITGSAVVSGYDKESIYVWNGTSWTKPLKYTDDTATTLLQTGLANGTTTIKLTNAYIGATPLLTYISTEIDGKIGVYSGETAPVNGQPSGVSINDIYLWFTTASKVLANGTTQVYDITRTYKYSGSVWNEITTDNNITALADLADGKRTVFSGSAVPVGAVNRDVWIPSATNGVYIKGEIYQYNGTSWIIATKYSAEIATINTDLSEKALELANLDNRIDAEEQARIDAVLAEEQARIDAIDDRIQAESLLDGRIDTEEQARIDAINDVSDAYKEYSRVVTLAIADGVLTPEEEALIADASMAVTAAKDRLQGIINKAEDDLNVFVDAVYTPMATSLQNQIDGKVDSWFTDTDPNTWLEADRVKHNGDMWYNTNTKLSYYYGASTNSWNLIEDSTAILALENAASAQASVDGVVVSYYAFKQDTDTDLPTDRLWINISGSKVLKKYNGTRWESVIVKNGDTLLAYNPKTKDTTIYVYRYSEWVTETEGGMVAEAEAITALSASLGELDTTVNGASTVENTINARIKDGVSSVESKFAYNSVVTLNGVTHTSGFGLATTINSESIPKGESQFWVSADEFKVVGANQTADAQGPFTVNTTTGDITFRGKVTFNNGQTGTIDEAIAQVVETVSVGDKNINITDNLIPTTSLVADANNSGYQFIGSPVKSNTAGFSSFAEPQISMIAGDEVYSLYVDEMTIPYYYRFAIKGLVGNVDLNKFKIVTISSSNVVSYATITVATSEALVGTEWYEIDGIINPVGGDTAVASGSIRKSDGIKIGTINNFALPSGSVRLLLGWYGSCIISRMKLAKITADTLTGNYVTQDYVDNGINSKVSSATTDEIAKKLGYVGDDTYSAYEKMTMAAALGQTIINGGYLRTSLIQANSIVANQINTTGLVAENISSNTIDGKTITGGLIEGTIINGVVITGSTIKASYLDLDGELEVLTNFYLCVGGNTTGVPELAISEGRYRTYNIADKDAVLSSGYANIYRIPSISMVKEPSTNFSTGTTYGTLRSYNTANAGHNMKAVKRRPTFQNLSGIHIATGDVILKLGNITLGTFSGSGSNPTSNTYFHDFKFTSPYTSGYNNRLYGAISDEVYLYNVPVFGDLRVERNVANIGDGEIHWVGWINVYMAGGSHTLPFDWDNPSHVISIQTPNEGSTARISGIQINNMI